MLGGGAGCLCSDEEGGNVNACKAARRARSFAGRRKVRDHQAILASPRISRRKLGGMCRPNSRRGHVKCQVVEF